MTRIEELYAQLARGRDRQTLAVLADALVDAGDPRGELIHVQQRARELPEGEDRSKLAVREYELVGQLRIAGLGDLANRGELELPHVDGFVERAVVTAGPFELGDAVARVVQSPCSRLLETLVIDPKETSGDRPIATVLEHLRGIALPPTLRRLELGRAFAQNAGFRIFRDFGEVAFRDDLSELLAVVPQLTALHVDLGAVALTWQPLVSTTLRSFTYVTPRLHVDEIAALAASELPAVESVELWTGAEYLVNDESDLYVIDEPEEDDEDFEDAAGAPSDESVTAELLEPLFELFDRMPALTSLGLRNYAFAAGALVEALSHHACAQRLRRLDLTRANSFFGVAESIGRFPQLAEVALGANNVVARADFGRLAERIAERMQPENRELMEDYERYRYVVTQE